MMDISSDKILASDIKRIKITNRYLGAYFLSFSVFQKDSVFGVYKQSWFYF